MNYNNTEFENKSDLHKYLVANKTDLIDMRKSTLKYSDSIGAEIRLKHTDGVDKSEDKQPEAKLIKTIVGNTYNWMDSHYDVHVEGCFAKSIKERQHKIWHLHDHEYKITAKVGVPTKVYEQKMPWRKLGVDKAGDTEVLLMDTEIKKDYNKMVYDAYKVGDVDQHSVGMQYVKIELAIDDSTEEEEYKVWNKYYSAIANKERADETGFFWVVKEAKLIEISAVLEGSNTITPTLEDKSNEPSVDTQTKEPIKLTLQDMMKNFK